MQIKFSKTTTEYTFTDQSCRNTKLYNYMHQFVNVKR